MMKITLLGTGTTLPQVDRNPAGLLIDASLLFDCGPGILRQIERAGVDFTQVTNIFISHMHADHVSDLPILLKANYMRRNPNLIRIYGPSMLRNKMEIWFTEIYSYLNKVLDRIEIMEISKDDWVRIDEWMVQGIPVQHGMEAYGYKIISRGKIVVYSGDTGPCEELIQGAKNADALIHECSYPSDQRSKSDHTNPLELGKIAKRAGVKHLILTHFYPACKRHEKEIQEDIRRNYDGKVTLGMDLFTFEV